MQSEWGCCGRGVLAVCVGPQAVVQVDAEWAAVVWVLFLSLRNNDVEHVGCEMVEVGAGLIFKAH